MAARNLQKYIEREDFIREHLSYDSHSGHLRWIKRPWRSRAVEGEVVGQMCRGRLVVKIQYATLYVHHIAWWFITGIWPEVEIDHINNAGSDNRECNLREASRSQNARNVRPWKKSGLGLKGAFTHPSFNGKWVSQIRNGGRPIYLGRFDSEEEAHAAYCEAAKKYHGEFARVA